MIFIGKARFTLPGLAPAVSSPARLRFRRVPITEHDRIPVDTTGVPVIPCGMAERNRTLLRTDWYAYAITES